MPATLKALHLDDNNLTDLKKGDLQEAEKLSLLTLDDNDLTSFPDAVGMGIEITPMLLKYH